MESDSPVCSIWPIGGSEELMASVCLDYRLILWNITTGAQLCASDIPRADATHTPKLVGSKLGSSLALFTAGY